ncbi:MAG: class I SAM-dependent methyltransferase [Pseudomonadales bacterium]
MDTSTNQHPLRIDFTSPRLAHRRATSSRKAPLARATGAGRNVHVLDCTAGLGRDSFMLASFGCTVTMVERSPVLVQLLEDALDRAIYTDVSSIVGRMKILEANAIELLQGLKEAPDVIYLDPMFPPRSKHAKVKGDMQILQRYLGPDRDTRILIDTALATRCHRVVIKRPAHGAAIAELEPTFTLKGKTSRFDVFITSPGH